MPRSPATTTATAVATITTASADLRRWLGAPGSLTARLRLNGAVTVDVLAQGRKIGRAHV